MLADGVFRTYLKATHVGFMIKMTFSYDRRLYIFWKQFFKHLCIHLFLLPNSFDVQYKSKAIEHLLVAGCIFKLHHQNNCYSNMLMKKSSHGSLCDLFLNKISFNQVYEKPDATLSNQDFFGSVMTRAQKAIIF